MTANPAAILLVFLLSGCCATEIVRCSSASAKCRCWFIRVHHAIEHLKCSADGLGNSRFTLEELEVKEFSAKDGTRTIIRRGDFFVPYAPHGNYEGHSIWTVDFSHNRIKQLEMGFLQSLVQLGSVDLSFNTIERIPPGTFDGPKIKILQLQHNRLTKLERGSLTGQSELIELDLGYNQLSTIEEGAFSTLSHLRGLHLAHNRLSSLPPSTLKGMHQLLRLDMSYNQLQHLPNYKLYLQSVNVAGNQISDIDRFGLIGFSSLKTLDLSRNKLQNLKSCAFCGLIDLTYLVLAHNEIKNVEEHAFDSLKSLKNLQVENCSLTDDIVSSPGFRNMETTKLKIVSFQKNSLSTIPVDFFEKHNTVKYADFSDNRDLTVASGAFSNFQTVEVLKLARTSIDVDSLQSALGSAKYIQFMPNTNVTRWVADHGLPALKVLDMSDNTIRRIYSYEAWSLRSLEDLRLSNVSLEHISENSLCGLVNLTDVDLSHNPNLGSFDDEMLCANKGDTAFKRLRQQKLRIDVRHCGITELKQADLWWHNARMDGNPLDCCAKDAAWMAHNYILRRKVGVECRIDGIKTVPLSEFHRHQCMAVTSGNLPTGKPPDTTIAMSWNDLMTKIMLPLIVIIIVMGAALSIYVMKKKLHHKPQEKNFGLVKDETIDGTVLLEKLLTTQSGAVEQTETSLTVEGEKKPPGHDTGATVATATVPSSHSQLEYRVLKNEKENPEVTPSPKSGRKKRYTIEVIASPLRSLKRGIQRKPRPKTHPIEFDNSDKKNN